MNANNSLYGIVNTDRRLVFGKSLGISFRSGCVFLLLFDFKQQVHAALFVVIQHLAVQALNTFVFIDIAFGENRLHRTFLSAFLAGIAAFLIAFEPIEEA